MTTFNNATNIAPFSIVPVMYEKELDTKYNVKIGKLNNGRKSNFNGNLEKNVSFNGGWEHPLHNVQSKILDKYKETPDFCSMIIDDAKILNDNIKNIHELSYNHYIFGKETDMKGSFPSYCCGMASNNLFLTLMDKGYPNAAHLYNQNQDHCYVVLPFVFGKNKEEGFIIIDPTSDQLFHSSNSPRNNLFISSGRKWEYKTNWRGGRDLFPTERDDSIFANLHTLRKFDGDIERIEGINQYFENVFDNPVDINPVFL